MKIIDLLNKIANGEEVPKKIKYDYKKFEFIGGAYEDEKGNDLCYYDDSCMAFLNNEVEILEEKKIPEKSNIDFNTKLPVSGCSENEAFMMTCISHLGKTIDSLIDYLKSKGE